MRKPLVISGMGFLFALLFSLTVSAKTDVTKGAEIQVDPEVKGKVVKAILATFDQAEKAIQMESLFGIMALYSESYRHRGLRKEDTSRIWRDIFKRYDWLSSSHTLTKIRVDQKKGTAVLTCTGAIFGVIPSKREEDPMSPPVRSDPKRLDVWFEANHYMVLEDNVWKFIGHDPTGKEEGGFGAAIHLLF